MDGTLPTTHAKSPAAPVWRRPLVLGAVAAVALVAVAGVVVLAVMDRGPKKAASGETARVVRDRLVVTITEGGEIDAKKSVDIRCEVEGSSTIIWVIEEGMVVQKGDKLIELDSADLEERLRTQDMQFKTAKAAFEKAEKAYLIQQSTRESELSVAGLTVKFGLMDLRKYLGADVADRQVAAEGRMAISDMVTDAALGGEALQSHRNLQSAIDLADEELKRAISKAEWTRTLEAKGYVTGSELEADELASHRRQVELDQARTALSLFLQYEFPKAAEKLYTDWMEAKREYDRVDARTAADLASSQADLDTKREALSLEETRLKKAREQLDKTTILAPQPGMVVYDTGSSRWGQQNIIESGSNVRHQQTLFKLPDMSEMNVKTKLHESVVKQSREGAPAFVTIDAFPKERLTGRVTKIAVMPDRAQMWLNPGLKTYVTEVTLDSSPSGLKPGMSAQVEILVDSRDAVLQAPVSSIFVEKGFQVAYVRTPGGGVDVRRVEAGLSNDRAVEVTEGLKEGEEVFLFKPAGAPELQVSEEEVKANEQRHQWEKAQAEKAAPPPAADAAALTPEQLQALRDRMEKMTPEERAEAVKRLRESGVRVPGAGGERPPRGGAGEGDRPRRQRGGDDSAAPAAAPKAEPRAPAPKTGGEGAP